MARDASRRGAVRHEVGGRRSGGQPKPKRPGAAHAAKPPQKILLGRCLWRLAPRRALVATLSTPTHDTAGTWSDVERRQDSAMQAAQGVLLIVADDMQPSDIHALRHLHAPPILAETPWQALEHVPIWNFEPQ